MADWSEGDADPRIRAVVLSLAIAGLLLFWRLVIRVVMAFAGS